MAVHPSLDVCSVPRAKVFLLGFSDDARALLAHLDAEAPSVAASVRALDPDAAVVRALRARGVSAVVSDLWDDAALRAEGLGDASMVVVFADRVDRPAEKYRDLLRSVCPAADVWIVPRGAGIRLNVSQPAPPPAPVVTSWRFWVLVCVVIVDAVTLAVPLTPLVLVVAALVNRGWLRSAARFLDRLAEAR